MSDHYGLSRQEWERNKEKAFSILRSVAIQQATITYGELSSQLPSWIEPHSQAMAVLLGEISEEEDACGRGMLSAVVVHKEGDRRSGDGFFRYAVELGRVVTDRDKMWIEELRHVHAVWKQLN